jgi:heme-degrading monooxygenase HmoA
MNTGSEWGYVILWEFHPKAGFESKFEQAYGPNGIWAGFFRRGEGYCGTELVRDTNETGRYLTIDVWVSREAYEKFRQANLDEYNQLDRQCEEMTQTEVELGTFERLGRRKLDASS